MILNLIYKILLSFIFITLSFQANTKEDINEKVKRLTLELRCMTCQNQSVYDSEAEFSNDIKNIVQTKFEEGKTEKEIKIFLAERYGEYILFKPMIDYKNLFLWAFPFVLLAISLFFIVFKVKKNKV
ncbi:cytochrome c-type biogenesis protein CcmH [Pelagibacteraceae bacterium]|nr:cytochrome c-type biogenesis protein CcmH [Pelagibacteraceae bacterium]